jgi:integrase
MKERRGCVRVEQDRHFKCTPTVCKAPPPRRPLADGRKAGVCVPRHSWWVRYVDRDGKRVSEAYRDEVEARGRGREVEALLILKTDPRRVAVEKKTAPLFSDLADEALQLYTATRTLQPATRTNHNNFLKRHLLPAFGEHPVTAEHFSRLAIKTFIARIRGAGDPTARVLQDASLTAALPVLRLILDHAVERGLLPTNPMRGEPLWRATRHTEEVDPFTPHELRTILATARKIVPDFAVLIWLTVQAGLRPGEVLGLRRSDLDLAAGRLHVRRSFSRGRIGPTKTRSSLRTVSFLHPVLEEGGWHPRDAGVVTRGLLEGLRGLQVVSVDPDAPLFGSAMDPATPLRQASFQRAWVRVLKKAQMRYRKPHALRHSFASILLSRNAPLTYVTKAGGWRSATTLLQTYAKWVEQAEESASSLTSSVVSHQNEKR